MTTATLDPRAAPARLREFLDAARSRVDTELERRLTVHGDDPGRLRAMGVRAAAHARATVDWPVVLERHRALWAHLAGIRAGAAASEPFPHPLRPDPFRQFAGHPTAALTPELRLSRRADVPEQRLADLAALSVHRFAEPVIGFTDAAHAVLARLAAGDCTVGALTAGLDGPPRQQMVWTVGFLLKLGLIRAHR